MAGLLLIGGFQVAIKATTGGLESASKESTGRLVAHWRTLSPPVKQILADLLLTGGLEVRQ